MMNTNDSLVDRWTTARLCAVALVFGISTLIGADSVWAKVPGKKTPVKFQADGGPAEGVLNAPALNKPVDLTRPRPIIKPVSDEHNFGSVWVGPQLKHSFTIKNEGQAPLEISAVKPSCGCTIAGEYPRRLEPGQSGEFPFAMNSSKLRGNFSKSITVTSNDPVTSSLRLTLRGEVKQYVEITPQTATFGRITDQEPKTRELTIVNNTDKPLELELKHEPSDKYVYKLDEVEKGKRYSLKVTASPPFAEGTLNSSLTIATNIDEQKEIQVRTIATVPPRIEIQPNSILVHDKGQGPNDPMARVIRYTNYGKTPAKLLEATVDDPAVAVAVRERKEGEAYTVEVQLPAGYQPPPEGRTITLKIDDKEMPEVKIPIKPVQRSAAAAPPVERPKPEDMVGKPAPAFAIETIEGRPLSSDTLRDSVTVLNFFAPNCGFCKKQIPRLETVRQQFDGKAVRFVNVSQKMGKAFAQEEVVKIISDLGFKGELALNHENTVGSMFYAGGFPTMVVIGKDGKVAAVNVGNVGDLESRVAGQVNALLEGKPVPADAQPQLVQAERIPEPAGLAAQEAPKPATPEQAKPAQPPTQAPPPAPAPARVRPDDLIGKPAPAFSLKTIDGKDLSSDTVKNSPATVLNFFAPNCGFCKKQIPRLETISKDLEGKGVRFVNVTETMRQEFTQEQTMEILKATGWTNEVAIDPKNVVGQMFGATGFPTMVIVGKSGKVEAVNVGNIGDLETRVKGQLTALIEGKAIPQELVKAPTPPARPSPTDKVGQPAPAFTLTTYDGKTIGNNDLANAAATVLNFYAPNCGFCKKQIPRLETVRKEYQGKNVRFVNVTEAMGKEFEKDAALGVLKEVGWEGEVAGDPKNEVGQKFGTSGFPTMVVVGKNGKVQAVNVGNIGDLETKLKSQLDTLIAGKEIAQAPAPSAAPTDPAAPPPAPKRRPAEDLVGQTAPEFALTTMDGKPVASADFGKHPATVLNFVAPNCGFCKRQVPNVDKVRAAFEAKGVRFVNVAMKMGAKEFPNDEIIKIFKDAGSSLELAKDEGNQVGQKYKAVSFPTMIVVGRDGKVAHVAIGAKPDIEATLSAKLNEMISATP